MKKLWIADKKLNDLKSYTHLRGYHACRPVDVGEYLKTGIRLFGHEEMQRRAASVFGKEISDIVTLDDEPEMFPSNEIYFCVNKIELLEGSGHYLCWGSEYLAGVASSLDKGESGVYHTKLENTGIPTIFICDIPIELISQQCLNSIVEYYDPADSDCSFWINEPLPRSCIVGHEHPKRIFNPIKYCTYINKRTQCQYC